MAGVLVVDDQECIRGLLDRGLRNEGLAVWLAVGGREALRVYRDHRDEIDVVLLDVRMPDLDGPHTLMELRKLDVQAPCCFMTGDLGDYTERELRTLGAAAVFRKPFQLAEVARVLSQQAAHARRGARAILNPCPVLAEGERRSSAVGDAAAPRL